MKHLFYTALLAVFVLIGCSRKQTTSDPAVNEFRQTIYQDKPFLQEYSIKYFFPEDYNKQTDLHKVAADRNGNIQIASTDGLLYPYNGHMLIHGEILPERSYRYMIGKDIHSVISYRNQFFYSDAENVFSNAWGGYISNPHDLKKAQIITGGKDFDFMVSDGNKVSYWGANGEKIWEQKVGSVQTIEFVEETTTFLIVSSTNVKSFNPNTKNTVDIYSGTGITSITAASKGKEVIVGTDKGWLRIKDGKTGVLQTKVPWPEITDVEEINGSLWFGSTWGAYKLKDDGKYDYYASQRWLPDDKVVDVEPGPDGSILVLTETGLGQICFEEMTLYDKAMIIDDIQRKHYTRYGFCSGGHGMKMGNLAELINADSDNDGLWTGMYLGGELFRYAATKDPEAWENCKEALIAFERLYSITGVKGLPSRGYEVMGHESSGYTNALQDNNRHLFESSGYDIASSPWRRGTDEGWVWKSTTSSDEVVGHVFALSLFADLADDPEWAERAKNLVVGLVDYIYENDLYLVDWNGKPTTWGKWNPEYTNGFPTQVGDRKLTSSNIVAFLQAAYHFTKDEKYVVKIKDLFENHGYLENLMRPMAEIGQAGNSEDDKIESWAEMLSDSWNHSDDEMYFLGYWQLYPYALDEELKAKYKEAIRDHWEAERPEKAPVMNLSYAMTGAKEFDLDEVIWWLQEHPIDHVNWDIKNSHRKDIEMLPPNFREQFTKEVLSPAEGRVWRHNINRFTLDSPGNGSNSPAPGNIWTLPYWMGRYLNVISAPQQ